MKGRLASALGLVGLGAAAAWLPIWTGHSSGGAATGAPGAAIAATRPASQPSGPIDSNIFVNLAQKAVPSVVNISTTTYVKGPSPYGRPDDMFRQFFEQFFGRNGMGFPDGRWGDNQSPRSPHPQKIPQSYSLGSGFVIESASSARGESSAIILTNNHVVQGADEIKVQFTESSDETPTPAKVIGRDPELDIALIKVKARRDLAPLPLGDSDSLQVGQYVMAVGNPFGEGHSASHGIVSAKGRINPESGIGNWLQTDAPINPGNSGGPLLDLSGEVIGINTAIDARAQGIGFAIPINLVKKVLPQLRENGSVSRGYIGALVEPLQPEIASKIGAPQDLRAAFVANVYPGGPAERAGIRPYDVILKVGSQEVHSPNDLITAVTSEPVGSEVPFELLRSGRRATISLKVGKRPGANEELASRKSPESEGPRNLNTGLHLEDLTPQAARELGMSAGAQGALVDDVDTGSPAERAGLGRGDVIVEVDRKPVNDLKAFYRLVSSSDRSYLLRARKPSHSGNDIYTVVVLDLKG